MNKLLILLFTLNFYSFQAQTETINTILNKVNNQLEKKDRYKLNVNYTLYRGVDSNTKLAEYPGLLMFNNDVFYNKIDQTETITSNVFFISINHHDKTIFYSKDKNIFNNNKIFNLKQLLLVFDTGKLEEDSKNWICNLIPKAGTYLPYSKIVLVVNKKSLQLKKQLLFLSKQVNFSTNNNITDFDITRLEIDFLSISSLTKPDYDKFKLNRFINLNKDKVSLSNQFKTYHLTQK